MIRTACNFTPPSLLPNLISLPPSKRWLVGYSGGADSTALLLALHQLAIQNPTMFDASLVAVHFNHGLQSPADAWEKHCRKFCQLREIPLQVQRLSVRFPEGASPETAAREARYQAIARFLEEGDIYFTAHHADDQAETLFLNLMRGSGAGGLAGIPALRKIAAGWLARPLLEFRREALQDYLRSENVNWVMDPSNQDFSPDRNFLRGVVFPQLDQRWPGLQARLNRTSLHLRDQTTAFRELLRQGNGMVSEDGITLPIKPLQRCSLQLQAEIIRHWVSSAAVGPPPRARLQEFLQQLKTLRHDSQAEIRWGDHLIKHHAGNLWLYELPGPAECPARLWDTRGRLALSEQHGHLEIEGEGQLPDFKARVCNRSTLQDDPLLSLTEKKQIKEIMRLCKIPCWLRDTVPLLLSDGKLSAVGDWWLDQAFKQKLERANLSYHWKPEHPLLKKIQSVCHNHRVDPGPTLV